MIFRRRLLLLLFFLVRLSESGRKSRRFKELRRQETYELFRDTTLPSDTQITTFLYKGVPKIFYYWSTVNGGPLSVTISTCSSPVQWIFYYSENNATEKFPVHNTSLTVDMTTKYYTSVKGNYILRLLSQELDNYVHVYVSTEKGGPQALQNAHFQKLRLIKRQRRKRLTVRWDPSLVDPQGTDYCLIVHNKKNYKSLCSAQIDKFGMSQPQSTNQPIAASQTVIDWQPASDKQSFIGEKLPIIACVGRSTQYTVANLKQGQTYYFSLFATNRQSNFTYPFGSTSIKFDGKIKPIPLKDGVSTYANLKKYDGKAVFKFKTPKGEANPLKIFIIPCGSSVHLEMSLKSDSTFKLTKRNVDKFETIILDSPVVEGRYYIKILAANRDNLSRSSGIEILISSKPVANLPIPLLPAETQVKEYPSLKKCDSVTIGWLPSPGMKSAHYCVIAKEGRIRDPDDYEIPNQCELDNRSRKSVDVSLKHCKDIIHNSQRVITEKVNYLMPGTTYIIQVTVKKPRGRTLSYDLLQVHTKRSCHKHG